MLLYSYIGLISQSCTYRTYVYIECYHYRGRERETSNLILEISVNLTVKDERVNRQLLMSLSV